MRPAVLLLVLALAGGVVLRCGGFDAPFENGSRGINGSWYAGQAARHFDDFGFAATQGVPRLGSFPGTLGDSVPYVTHPAPLSWLFWAGTWMLPGERGIRCVPLLLALFSLPLCWWMLRRHATPLAAAAGTLIWAVHPMASYFGSIPSGESLLLPWLFGFWILADRWFCGANPHALVALFFAGAVCDWSFYWAAPALGLVVLLRGELGTRWKVLCMLAGAGMLALMLCLVHFASVLGTAALRAEIAGVIGGGLQAASDGGLFAGLQGHLLAVCGWPSLLVLSLLFTAALCRVNRLAPLRVPLLFFALVGVLHTVVFVRHANVHEFWTMPATGMFACAAALLVDAVTSKSLRALVVLLVLGAAVVLALSSHALTEQSATTVHRDRVAAIPELGEEFCIGVVEPFWVQEVWYARAHLWTKVETAEAFGHLRDAYVRIYSAAARRPAIVIILERGRKGESAAGLRKAVYALGIAPVARGAFDVYRIPGTG